MRHRNERHGDRPRQTHQPKHNRAFSMPLQIVVMRTGCPLGIAVEIGRTRFVIARERSQRWHVAAQMALQAEMFANAELWD